MTITELDAEMKIIAEFLLLIGNPPNVTPLVSHMRKHCGNYMTETE